jgi:predicted nucleic acid-binding protein
MIAAVMIVHGGAHIVTFNKGHFERFGKITALLLSEV